MALGKLDEKSDKEKGNNKYLYKWIFDSLQCFFPPLISFEGLTDSFILRN